MKVLYLINYAGKGGSEKYVKVLAQSFIKKNINIFFAYNQKGPLVNEIENLGIKTYNVNMKGPFDVTAAKKIAAICKENNIDIIHSQFPRENYIAILSKLFGFKKNVVYTSHININNNILWKTTNFIVTKQNSAVIAVCNSAKPLLVSNKYPKNKINVIFNGVPYQENYKSHAVKNDIFTFVTLARLSPEKGIFFLLDSIKVLSTKTNKPFKVVVAGDGPLEEEAKSYAKTNDILHFVDFIGYTENSKQVLEGSHVFINSSESEALSFAILEAMSTGLPVIATNVGGNPDIVNKNTNCGILVKYNEPLEMANAMYNLLNDSDLYQELSKNSLVAIKDTFNIEITINKTYELYKSILKS